MEDRDDKLPSTDLNRLITFELDPDEMLYIAAGRGEMENRTIYHGQSQGRYAVVPVDALQTHGAGDSGEDIKLDLAGLGLVGDTVSVPKVGEMTVGLHAGGRQYARMDRPGAYGMLWIPGE